jgi:hypothetical protein
MLNHDDPKPISLYGYLSADSIHDAVQAVDQALDDVTSVSEDDVNSYRDHIYKVTVTVEKLIR